MSYDMVNKGYLGLEFGRRDMMFIFIVLAAVFPLR
jgi:hypothetical protein